MRKKYLSALLFGALLFASAGTFTSCKDYDDDINNLQEQINTINTTLTELKNQVGTAGVSSVTFDETTGILTVVDGNGTKTYNIATSAEALVEAEIKDGKLYINNEEVGPVVGEVTVDGNDLKVDGETVATIGDNSVTLVKDEANGVCTIKVDDQTVTLPLSTVNTVATIKFEATNPTFGFNYVSGGNTDGFNYGTASADVADWAGPKGAVTKGDFLVGQINSVTIDVNPYNYDLTGKKLALVDTEGNEAPVDVTATPTVIAEDGEPATGTRAASASGKWDLSISMKESVTEKTIAKDFMYSNKNVLYALAIDGNVVSAYDLAVKAAAQAVDVPTDLTTYNFVGQGINSTQTIKVGKNAIILSNKYVYDSYLKFEGVNEDKAKEYGVEADGMTLTLKDAKAAGANDLVATLYVLTVDGRVDKETVNITIESSTIDTPSETTASEFTIVEKDFNVIDINAENVFTYADVKDMSNANLQNYSVSVVSNNADDFLFATSGDDKELTLTSAALMVADKDGKPALFDKTKNTAADIKWVRLTFSDTNYQSTAKAGDYKLQIVVKDAGQNETVKFTSDLKVSFPSIDTFLTKSAAWSDKTVKMNVEDKGSGTVQGSMLSVYNLKEGASKTNLSFVFDYNNIQDGVDPKSQNSPIKITKAFNKEEDVNVTPNSSDYVLAINEFKTSTLTVYDTNGNGSFTLYDGAVKNTAAASSPVTYYLQPITFKTVYNVKGIAISSEKNTMNIVNPAANTKLVYLDEKGKEQAIVLPANNTIPLGDPKSYDVNNLGQDETITAGLFLSTNGVYSKLTNLNNYSITITNKDQTGAKADVDKTSGIKLKDLGAGAYDITLKVTNIKSMGITFKDAGSATDIYYDLPSLTISKK